MLTAIVSLLLALAAADPTGYVAMEIQWVSMSDFDAICVTQTDSNLPYVVLSALLDVGFRI